MSWYPISRRRDRDWDFGGNLDVVDPSLDVDRDIRRMNRQMRRLERDLLGDVGFGPSLGWGGALGGPSMALALPNLGFGGLSNVGSLVDRNFPILPSYVDQGGQKLLQFQVDTSGFRPEDIQIKTQDDNKLIVSGKHEEKTGDFHRYREFHRTVTIPQGAKIDQMKSRLNPDGLLVIEAPFEQPAIQQQMGRELPIQHEGKLEQRALQSGEQRQQPAAVQSGRQETSVQRERGVAESKAHIGAEEQARKPAMAS